MGRQERKEQQGWGVGSEKPGNTGGPASGGGSFTWPGGRCGHAGAELRPQIDGSSGGWAIHVKGGKENILPPWGSAKHVPNAFGCIWSV